MPRNKWSQKSVVCVAVNIDIYYNSGVFLNATTCNVVCIVPVFRGAWWLLFHGIKFPYFSSPCFSLCGFLRHFTVISPPPYPVTTPTPHFILFPIKNVLIALRISFTLFSTFYLYSCPFFYSILYLPPRTAIYISPPWFLQKLAVLSQYHHYY